MIETFCILAEASDVGSDIMKTLAGAGTTALLSWRWILRESSRADKAQGRVDEISDKAITALTEVSIYLADTSRHLESVGGVVGVEHEKTREHVSETLKTFQGNGGTH